jgi:hypothetical protein
VPDDRKILLLCSEEYLYSASQASGPVSRNKFFTCDQVREVLKEDIEGIRQEIESTDPHNFLPRLIVCMRMFPEYLAKSYEPTTLIGQMHNSWIVGSRYWDYQARKEFNYEPRNDKSRLVLVETSESGLRSLSALLSTEERGLPKGVAREVTEICKVDLLRPHEKQSGFPKDWSEGRVELVFHSVSDLPAVLERVCRLLEVDSVKHKMYPEGLLFVSARVTKHQLDRLSLLNPLRTCHPLRMSPKPRMLMRSTNVEVHSDRMPVPRSPIGMFDGGVDPTHPVLNGYVQNYDLVSTQPDADWLDHGTAVAGVLTFGALDLGTDPLIPRAVVRSFRVFPQEDPKDVDLYDTIDLIEDNIPKHNDIQVWNTSFGPDGPIVDDPISRFTFAMDKLMTDRPGMMMINAVGNDGEMESPLNRVQSPSDMVNGLGVGAHTLLEDGTICRAPYSCLGPGRDGSRVKPDVCAFGGCSKHPFQVLSRGSSNVSMVNGTSFAAPLVSGLAHEMLSWCQGLDALAVKALLIHTAKPRPGLLADNELGHGVVRASKEDVYSCGNDEVTIVTRGSISPKAYARLPLFVPRLPDDARWTVQLMWTIVVSSPVQPGKSDAYTDGCVTCTFYPNVSVFTFTNPADPGNSIDLHLRRNRSEVERVKAAGWRQSLNPVSDSPKRYRTEHELRNEHKWDTVARLLIRKEARSLESPFIILHGQGRNGLTRRLPWALVQTITVKNYPGDLYADVRTRFTLLTPMVVRVASEILVQV